MKIRKKIVGSAVSAGLAVLIILLLVAVSSLVGRVVPDNPITSPEYALAAPSMLVSPNDEEGDAQSDEGTDDQSDQNQTNQSTDAAQSPQDQTQAASTTVSNQTTPSSGGNTSGNDQGQTGSEEPGVNKDVAIVTNLANKTVTKADLTSAGELGFYAYLRTSMPVYSLKVKVTNSSTPGNGTYLTSSDGKNYLAPLVLGDNVITLYMKQGASTIYQTSFTIFYSADKANEDNPTVGDNPPTIVTNLDGGQNATINRTPFTFQVSASDYKGSSLYSDHIQVWLDGNSVSRGSGTSGTFDYDLAFTAPVYGDTETHTVSVRAWDSEGNSRYESFTVTYKFVDTGDNIGKITVVFDLTTLGLGVPVSYQVDINQGQSLVDVLSTSMGQYGYTMDFDGDYLSRISGGGIASGVSIPDNLWQKILADGLSTHSQTDENSLGDSDFTQGSGWEYMVNGGTPSRTMGSCYVNNGDVITLAFTLAYGKDLGMTSGTGALSSYCGTWLGGGYTEHHSISADSYTVLVEPTCTVEGQACYKCSVCGETSSQTGRIADGQTIAVPALGHDWVLDDQLAPTETEDGYNHYTCSRCGEQKTEVVPATGA